MKRIILWILSFLSVLGILFSAGCGKPSDGKSEESSVKEDAEVSRPAVYLGEELSFPEGCSLNNSVLPLIQNRESKAEAYTCTLAIRRAQDAILVEFLSNPEMTEQEAYVVVDESKLAREDLCPGGGDYYLVPQAGGSWRVTCGLHEEDTKLRTKINASRVLALVQGITENLPRIAEGAGELIPKIIATVVDKLPEIIDTGFEITVELVKGILKALPKIVESVVQLIGSMVIKFTEYDWLSLGKNLILGIKDGVVQYAYELINAVTDAGEKAYNAVKDFFGIASPSKLMRDGIGAYLPAGIAAGIIDNENEVTDAMDELADEAAKTTFTLPKIQGGGYQGDAYGGYYGQAKQPVTVQFVLPDGRVIAEWIEPDITNIQDTKVMIGQRGYAT